jgi:hypothetical protein
LYLSSFKVGQIPFSITGRWFFSSSMILVGDGDALIDLAGEVLEAILEAVF